MGFLCIRGNNICTPEGMRAGYVLIQDGLITGISDQLSPNPSREVIDIGDSLLMPGLVDPHVHLNEPGRADWEGFATGTRSAAAGGITTLVDMPLN
ncbi:MAG TPA: amidohydrolase family protein, partial [Niastella sp.]